jgi:hypothetical protein
MRLRISAVATVIALATIPIAAGPLTKGDKETSFRLSFAKVEFGSAEGFDLGSTETLDASFSYGWLLSDSHEIGGLVAYNKQDYDGGDLFEDQKTDGSAFGVFYNYNFKTQGNLAPFVGVSASVLGGDVGDLYDWEYDLLAGIKLYPFEHAGVVFEVSYGMLQSSEDGLPDGDGLALGVGLLLKY